MFEVGDKVIVQRHWLYQIDKKEFYNKEFKVVKVLNNIVKVTRNNHSMLVQKQHVKKLKDGSYTKQKRKLKL